jgi:hypothetical protein
VAVRRTEARAGGLVSADYVLLVLGIDEDTDAHVALLACPKGTVAGVETDCLLQLALLAIVSAEKLQDDDRMTAALALLTDGVRRVSLEKLCEDKKARRQKRKLEAFEGSDTESEAGAAVPDSGSKDCKEEQHGGQSADKTPKSSRPPRKRTRSPGSQSSHRGSGASVKTEDTVATTSGKDKRQNSGRSGTGGSGKPPAAITNSPNQDAQVTPYLDAVHSACVCRTMRCPRLVMMTVCRSSNTSGTRALTRSSCINRQPCNWEMSNKLSLGCRGMRIF